MLARNASGIKEKAAELSELGYPFVIVSGEKLNLPHVVYREPKGKFDAINFGLRFVPSETDVVAFNDVDTVIHNFEAARRLIQDEAVSLVFARVNVEQGPQLAFYSFLDALRRRVPIAASGELMLIKHELLKRIYPLKSCKAEDSYILFRVLEKGGRAAFSEGCFVTTRRTTEAWEEEAYKRRTVGGIYQALSMARPPIAVRIFYILLPLISPLLLISGRNGYYWTRGIISGYVDYIRGSKEGFWYPTY